MGRLHGKSADLRARTIDGSRGFRPSVSAPLTAVIMSSLLDVMKAIVTSVGDSIHVTDNLATMRSCPGDAGEREPVPQGSKGATACRLDAMAYCTDTPERKRKPVASQRGRQQA